MRKCFATIVTSLLVILLTSGYVFAAESVIPYGSGESVCFHGSKTPVFSVPLGSSQEDTCDDFFERVESAARTWYLCTGQNEPWAVFGLNTKNLQGIFCYDKKNIMLENSAFWYAGIFLDPENAKTILESMDANSLKTAVKLFVLDEEAETVYNNLNNLGVTVESWDTQETDFGFVTLKIKFSYLECYTINKGDTLSRIAAKYSSSVEELLSINPSIADPALIYAGDILFVK